jgi:ATP synthase protein I
MPDPEPSREEALKRLDERANALEARTVRPTRDYGAQAVGSAYRIFAEMLGGVGVGVAIGLVVDGFAGTAPLATIAFVLLGFGVAIWMALRTAKRASALAGQAADPVGSARPETDDGA